MIYNKNEKQRSKKAENKKVAAYNYERCHQEMLENSSNARQDPDQPDGESSKMCNSYYGLIAVKSNEVRSYGNKPE